VTIPPPTLYARSLACAPPGDRANAGAESSSGSQLPAMVVILELVELYFDLIHDQFHSLFHRSSFTEDVMHDRVPHVILNGMMAMSAR
jgi:hypothetical protein